MNEKHFKDKDKIFDVVLNDNLSRASKLSQGRISWFLCVKANIEKWWLKVIKKLDPLSERVVRIYTYNDETCKIYSFKCPYYTFDRTSYLYDDFSKICHKIGETLQRNYKILGKYYYDVKITLNYHTNNLISDTEWDMTYNWEVVKTNNPRCILGNSRHKKDCSYLVNFNSKLTIEGYSLNGDYKQFADVLSDLSDKVIIMHSKYDARAFLRIVKFLGVTTIYLGKKAHYNIPAKYGVFNKIVCGYYLDKVDDSVAVYTIHKNQIVSTNPENILDINEFIVKRSLKSKLKDWRGKW